MSERGRFLGIDMGGTNIRAAVVDDAGTVIDSVSTRLPAAPAARADAPLALAEAYADVVGAIGLAIAGTVEDGVVTWSANLGLRDVEFERRVRAATGRPAVLLNDARAAGLAEARVGGGAGARSVLSLTVGTGIGGALIVDGGLVMGTGDAGEVGHMVIEPGGRPCTCGRRGCWEQYVSGRALQREASAHYPDDPAPLDRLLDQADSGDARAASTVDRVVEHFALGLDNLCAVLAPEAVVLGGGVIARDGLIAKRYLGAGTNLRWGARSAVVASRLGDRAGQIGAALAAARLAQNRANTVQ